MVLNEVKELWNGKEIPVLGAGTWMVENDDAARVVRDALDVGYRHIDTAASYGNEEGVGRGIRESGVPREEIYLVTKVKHNVKDYDSAVREIDASFERLGVDYIDLMLIHSPQPWDKFRDPDEHFFEENVAVWKALEEAYEAGRLGAIGVSNFLVEDLENLITNASVKPMVNQVLAHITNVPTDVIEYCEAHDIVVEAYSPIAHGAILKHEVAVEIAEKYDVSPAQLSLRYVLQLGLVALPKSTKKAHMQSNAELDFVISPSDMLELDALPLLESYGDDEYMPVFSNFYK